jgi:hypothetical protein
MTRERLIEVLRNTTALPRMNTAGLPRSVIRTVYEGGDRHGNGTGDYYVDYPTYGGTFEKVPRSLIDQMESDGSLVRAFPDDPNVNAWRLPA